MVSITKTALSKTRGMWVNGSTDDGFKFCAKMSDKPSRFGLPTPEFENGGRVFLLEIRDAANTRIYDYNASKTLISTAEGEDAAYEVVATLENNIK